MGRKTQTWLQESASYLHDLDGGIAGFFVRASDQVALLFEPKHADFIGPVIPAGDNFNLFDKSGRWIGFFVPNGNEGFNQFEVSGRWTGYVVGEILPKVAP